MAITVRIREHERGLRFVNGDFAGLVKPGRHRLWSRIAVLDRERIEVVGTLGAGRRFEHDLLEVIARHASVRGELEYVELPEAQRALVWIDGRLAAIHGPGRYAYWKTGATVSVERFETPSLRLVHPLIDSIVEHKDASRFLELVDVSADHEVLLYRSGELVGRLPPGRHAFWKGAGRLAVKTIDRREQTTDVSGQEILTADKVSLRVNLVVAWVVTDAPKAASTVADADQALYREAQLALRASVGARTLDALLADKASVGDEIRAALTSRAAEFGASVRSVGLRDLILPGEMKTILNRVIEAEKAAQAELIRRREETASARSQANTARLLAENPVLARVRELELLKDVLAGTKATFVFAPTDLAQQVRALVGRGDEPDTRASRPG